MARNLTDLQSAIQDADGWLEDAEADAAEWAQADEQNPGRVTWPEMEVVRQRIGEIRAQLKTILDPVAAQIKAESDALDEDSDRADATNY